MQIEIDIRYFINYEMFKLNVWFQGWTDQFNRVVFGSKGEAQGGRQVGDNKQEKQCPLW